MKKSVLIALTLLTLVNSSLFAQMSGIMKDKTTGLPLEFVNIGLVGKSIGTVSDENGAYKLTIDASHENDTLKISYIGYKPLALSLKEFKKRYGQTNASVLLEQSNVQLQEVVIKPKKTITKIIGNTNNSKSVTAGFTSNDLGSEIGVPMKIKTRLTYIEELNFNIANNSYDTVVFRVNVYTIKNGVPDSNILVQPIYVKLNSASGTLTVDLKDKNIHVDHDFFVSLEWLKDLGKGQLFFPAGLMNSHSYVRNASQGKWEKIPIGIGFYCKISYQK